jgi:hypothetical protein
MFAFEAEKCRGVWPFAVFALGSAPLERRRVTSGRGSGVSGEVDAFKEEAMWRGVQPEPSVRSGSKDLRPERRETVGRWAWVQAQWIGRRSSGSRRVASLGFAWRGVRWGGWGY